MSLTQQPCSQEGRTTNVRETHMRNARHPRTLSARNFVDIGIIDSESEGNLANAMPAVLRKTTVKRGATIWS